MRSGATSWRCQIFSNSVVGWDMWSAPPQAGGDDGEQHGLALAGVLEVMGKVGVERHAVALGERVALAVDVEDDVARVHEGHLAGAGLVDRRVAGTAGGGARCEDVARELGALPGLRWRQDLVAVARRPTLAALPRTGDRDGAGLVEAQQLAESEIETRGDS